MVDKGQGVVLPYLLAKGLPGLRLSPPCAKVEQDQRPCGIGDYIDFKTNTDIFPVACFSTMQFGRALNCLIRKIVYTYPALDYVYLLKADVSDGFYRIGLRPEDAPKLGLVFPSVEEEQPMVAIPLNYLWDGKIPHPYSAWPRKR